MRGQPDSLQPHGLSRSQLIQLGRLADEVLQCSILELQQRSRGHVEQALLAQARNSYVNASFAKAIADLVDSIVRDWDTWPPDAQYWLRGAIQYFVFSDDGEPDFASVIGFEDDAEVLNSCLRLIGRPDWQLKPEDFDNV
jgi:uncharacterized membrane protein YkvA (DUF1232 family)